MKKSRYTEEQVAYALRLAESGTPVAEVCRQAGIAEATFYLWKKKYGSLGVSEVRELRQTREENARLKRFVADLTWDKQILQEVMRKRGLTSSQAGTGAVDSRPLPSELSARVCARAHLPEYLVHKSGRDASACACGSARSRRLDRGSATCASGSCCGVKAGDDNKKRVHRLVPPRGPAGRDAARRRSDSVCAGARCRRRAGDDQHWSMDFVHDQLRFASIAHAQPLIEGWRRDYNAPVRLAHSVT